jgi:hypothetical protein
MKIIRLTKIRTFSKKIRIINIRVTAHISRIKCTNSLIIIKIFLANITIRKFPIETNNIKKSIELTAIHWFHNNILMLYMLKIYRIQRKQYKMELGLTRIQTPTTHGMTNPPL